MLNISEAYAESIQQSAILSVCVCVCVCVLGWAWMPTATPDNYNRFSEIVTTTVRHNIPRGCYTNYIPGLTTSARQMYSTYKRLYENDPFDNKTIAAGEEVINATSEMRQSSRQAAIEDRDMTRNSHKAWKLIEKLNNDNTKSMQQHSNITANQISHQLLLNGKTPHSTRQLKPNLNTDGCNPNFTKPFCLIELKQCINSLENGKATELKNIMTEELNHFGHKTLVWLLQLFNHCLALMRIPKIGSESRVLFLLKLWKDP